MKMLPLSFLLALVFTAPLVAEDNADRELLKRPVPINAPLMYLWQGEKREISQDLIAQLEGDELEIALQDQGLLDAQNEDFMVSLIQPSGERIDERPDQDGKIVFKGVQQGLAALVVTADSLASTSVSSLYAAIPFFVMPGQAAAPPTQVDVPLALVTSDSLTERLDASQPEPSDESEIMQQSEFDVAQTPSSRFQVQRMADGSVVGQIIVPQKGYLSIPGVSRVTFQQNGEPLVSTFSDENGYFEAERVPLGVNSIVASGPSGHAAYSIDVVEFQGAGELINPTADNAHKTTRLVSRVAAASDSLLICLIPPALMDEVQEVLDERLPSSAPVASNVPMGADAPAAAAGGGGFAASGSPAFGGGVGGGGAGGGGFGVGLGELASVGILGASVAALADDDDGFNANAASGLSP